ncbi:acyltransferase [Oryzobacter telluris]|uniref:acyltransferase n=1 Tax=Oryzobacter telluris TaxID=3149179 RepID=UPI00370DCAC2
MTLARRVVESPPSVRWHLARLKNPVYRRTFRQFGAGTVIVRPHILRGVDRISLGAGCAIHDRAWLQAEGERGDLVIGDGSYLGHDVHLHAIDPVRIGAGCVLADGVFVATSDHERADRSAVRGTGPVTVGDRVFIGQRAVVLGGVTIGEGATVGAGAVVTHDVPAGATVAGVPARVVGGSS